MSKKKKLGNSIRIYLISFIAFFTACNTTIENDYSNPLPTDNTRTWIGPEYWANPMQDWQLNNGQIECIESGGLRKVFILTKEIGQQSGLFSLSVKAKNINTKKDTLGQGWIGFEIGIKGEFNDYRDNAVRGSGFPIGICTDGKLFIGKIDSTTQPIPKVSLDDVIIEISASEQSDGNYSIRIKALIELDQTLSQKDQFSISRNNIPKEWIEGGIAIICHNGALVEFPDEIKPIQYPNWGTAQHTQRGGNIKFSFSDLKILGNKISEYPERVFGPILFAQYTLGKGILTMTAQMPPIGEKDENIVTLQIKNAGEWSTISKSQINALSRTATFKISSWNKTKDTPYRLTYQLYSKGNKLKDYYYEGIIRKEPKHKEELVVAAFTGNNDLGFPNNDIVRSVQYHNPDLLFFSGDQIYEGVGGYGAQRSPFNKSVIDYLRKWYLYGWAYGDLLRNTPSIAIPDDHDVYHGNIWGAGGKATPAGKQGAAAQDMGGYKMPAEWVNMVQRTQTSHFPTPYDSTPIAQDISVYYTELNYAGISFAIIEDRKFKSAPKTLLPNAAIYNGWAQNKTFDEVNKSDVKGAILLGQRQLDFLEYWSSNWSDNTWMKVVLSQTIFANVATLPKPNSHSDNIVPQLRILKKGEYPPDDIAVADFDSNGWPQSGRNKALKAIRKSFAFHIAGDQHLGSTIQYGIDDWQDAAYAFCVPSISNVWPRRWYPSQEGENRKKDAPKYTGDFTDGFGNKMSVFAISNPVYTGKKPSRLYDRATGFGIIRFHKTTRDITMECWPRQANPKTDKQYLGWPITINQEDNFANNAKWFLPELIISGKENTLVQIINEANEEMVSILRINGNLYQPKVLKKGSYSIIIEHKDEKRIIKHILAKKHKNNENIQVDF